MKPSDPTAVAKRFAAVVARGLKRADRELAAHSVWLREMPAIDEIDDEPADPDPVDSFIEVRKTRSLTRAKAREIILSVSGIARRDTQMGAVNSGPFDECRPVAEPRLIKRRLRARAAGH